MHYFPKTGGTIRGFAGVEINNLITGAAGTELSLSVATLRGEHPPTMTRLSDRAYYVIEGDVSFTVGTETFQASAGDAVLVPKGTGHAMEGSGQYVVVNTPPFDPEAEEAAP